jgi:hypothetical protein
MRSSLALWSYVCLLAAAAACGSTDDGGPDDTPDPEPGDTLVVMPALARLEVINGVAATQDFTVTLVKVSGATFDVTDDVTWTLGDPLIGSFSGPTFTARGGSAGISPANATLDILTGTASIEVFVRNIRVGPMAPPNAPDLFATGTEDPGVAPSIAYPPADAIVPRNLGDLEMHWRDNFAHDVYELSMVNDHVDLKLYIGNTGPTGWAGFSTTEWYAASMGGREISLKIRALTAASPQTIGATAPQKLHLTNDDLEGGLYYWASTSASGASGIFRHDFGNPGQPAEPFYTNTLAGRCVACHALSRNGERMTITYDGGNGSSTWLDVASQAAMIPHNTEFWNFAAYSPDGGRLVTSRGGTLSVRDGATGTAIGIIENTGFATHPDFSPTNTFLAYVRTASGAGAADWAFTGGEIVTVPLDTTTGTWGTPTTIVTGGGNNYYPSISPDGQWILFNRSDSDAYDDVNAELWVARVDGSGARKLDLANIGPGYTNSWPRWAPFRSAFGDAGAEESLFWITWSSKREFGVRLAGGQPQLWMSPFFPDRVAAGNDPTAPAFRLPFQDIASNNHIAQWTEVVVPIGKMTVTPLPNDPPPSQVQR